MQPTLQAFFNGQASNARPVHQKKNHTTEVYFGQAFRDDAIESAALICNFLDAFYHQIVCIYGRYPPRNIKSSSFSGVFTKKCTDERVVEYFQLCRPTLRRWLLHQQIKTFSVALLSVAKEVVAEFRVNFYEPTIGMKRNIHDFGSELETLNHQLCKALVDLQNSAKLKFVCEMEKAPSFQIHIHSNGELEEPQTLTEHEWTHVDSPKHAQIATLHASSQHVSCPLSEMRFNYMSFEQVDPRDVHEIEKSPQSSSSCVESDVIVLD